MIAPKRPPKLPIGKVVCVGRNYAAHAAELGNAVPQQPVLFIKPSSAVVSISVPLQLPPLGYAVHYEAELCVQIGQSLENATSEAALAAICGVTVGLDLTLRDLQAALKNKGLPWERAKSFAGACVLADWISPEGFGDFSSVQYAFSLNGEQRQFGDTSLMLFPIADLLVDISNSFGLQAGDVVMTGTPKGVGELMSGDAVELTLLRHDSALPYHQWATTIA